LAVDYLGRTRGATRLFLRLGRRVLRTDSQWPDCNSWARRVVIWRIAVGGAQSYLPDGMFFLSGDDVDVFERATLYEGGDGDAVHDCCKHGTR
jgi:hypothetical protein